MLNFPKKVLLKKRLMIKLLLAILFLTISINLQSQRRQDGTWMNIAIKGSYGTTYLLNKNISDDGNIEMDLLSPSYSYGLRAGFTISEFTSISVEAANSTYIQKYEMHNAGVFQDLHYTKSLQFEARDYAIFFRLTNYDGVYFEIGPKLSWLKTLIVSNTIDSTFTDITKEGFKDRTTSLVLGAGMAVLKTRDDRLRLNVGLRMHITLDDVLTDVNKPPVKDGLYEWNYSFFDSYNNVVGTRPLLLQAVVELDYYFGYYGNTKRGRTRFVLFRKF